MLLRQLRSRLALVQVLLLFHLLLGRFLELCFELGLLQLAWGLWWTDDVLQSCNQ